MENGILAIFDEMPCTIVQGKFLKCQNQIKLSTVQDDLLARN